MKCPKCGSTNISVQIISETQLKEQHHGIFWWLLIGWWWIPIKWIFFTIPALIVKIFAPKRLFSVISDYYSDLRRKIHDKE